MNGIDKGNVATFRKQGEREELARIRRLTGLDYTSIPVSLINHGERASEAATAGQQGSARTGRPGIR